MRYVIWIALLSTILAAACQKETFDEESGIQSGQTLYVTEINILGDTPPFLIDSSDSDTIMDSLTTNGQRHFYKEISLNPLTRYTIYFEVNRRQLYWLHSGDPETRNLTLYSRDSQFMPLPMQRPLKIAFSVTNGGAYTFRVDPYKMVYTITGPGATIKENRFSTIHLQSPQSAYSTVSPTTRLNPSGYTYRIIMTNLIPGTPFPFRLIFNSNQNEALAKDASNPFTTGNNLLDGDFLSLPHNKTASFIPTSEVAYFNFDPISRSYTVDMSSSPVIADGLFDPAFYGAAVLSNTNAADLRDIRTVSIKDYSESWYIAVEGTFTGASGIPVYAAGVRFVLFIDDTTDNSGVKNSSLTLYPGLEPVTVPAGKSVEYLLVMESSSDPAQTTDGPWMLRSAAVKLYGPLTASMTNTDDIIATEKRLYSFSQDAPYGFFSYGNVYEILIPRTNHTAGVAVLPVEQMRVCLASWNAGTGFGNMTNTNHIHPLASTVPGGGTSNTLPGGVWPLVP